MKTAMHVMVFLKKKELQAFEPPFDMSQCVDGDCHDCAEHMHGHSHADTINNSELLAQHCCPEEGANTRETENKKVISQSESVYFLKH